MVSVLAAHLLVSNFKISILYLYFTFFMKNWLKICVKVLLGITHCFRSNQKISPHENTACIPIFQHGMITLELHLKTQNCHC
jgi:hypothetical protein